MLKISMIPVMTRIVSKLDLKPVFARLKDVDIFEDGKVAMSMEQVGLLLAEVFAEIAPQLDKVGAEIPEFVALYKGMTVEEAGELDIFEVFKELKTDKGILDFFGSALQKKVEPKQ